jgi:hypothetical protein
MLQRMMKIHLKNAGINLLVSQFIVLVGIGGEDVTFFAHTSAWALSFLRD